MKYNLRINISQKKAVFGLGGFALVFGVLTSLLGEIFMPLFIGVYSALLLFDKNSKRSISVAVGVLSVLAAVLLGIYIPTVMIFSVLMSFLIYFMFIKEKSKGECVGYCIAVCSLMLITAFCVYAFISEGSFSFEAITDFCSKIYDQVKNSLTEYFAQMASRLPAESQAVVITEQEIGSIIDSVILTLPSFIVVISFIIVGISLKIFSSVSSRMIDKPEKVFNWRFSTGNLFAYFYIALLVLSFFADTSDAFGIVVSNLYTVFLVIYAYIGFNVARAMFMQRKSAAFSTFILIVLVLLLSNLAISLLSFLGVFFTITKNKVEKKSSGNE